MTNLETSSSRRKLLRILRAALVGAVFLGGAALLERPAEAQAPPAGTFASGGTMGGPRLGHAAALLGNGQILIYGTQSTADLYDPATQRTDFLATPTSEGIIFATATTLRDGRVLIVGGERITPAGQADVPLATALLFDPQARTWTTVSPMTVARYFHTATLLADGRVLIVGGLDRDPPSSSTAASLRTSEVFDPATGRFTPSGTLPIDVAEHTATLLKDGRGPDLKRSRVLVRAGERRLFARGLGADPALRGTATLLDDGNVLLIGGDGTGTSPSITSAERFDPATGRFTQVGALSEGRSTHTATRLSNGQVLVAGGYIGDAGANQGRKTTELFDPASNRFVAGPTMAVARYAHTATALADGRVVIAGGLDGTLAHPSIELYTPATPARPFAGAAPAAGSQGLLVTTRIANADDLVKALSTDGCSARVIAYLQAGTWKIYIPGAPTVVNAAFPASLPATTPLFIGCA